MKNSTRRFVAMVGIGLALMMPMNMAFADSENMASEEFGSLKTLSAEWQQWALSIPTPENPQIDTIGGKGVVGQRGSIWFLAGVFGPLVGPGGTANRTCSVPEGKVLYFPVINSVRRIHVEIKPWVILGAGPDVPAQATPVKRPEREAPKPQLRSLFDPENSCST
jgi:hypothetical protein